MITIEIQLNDIESDYFCSRSEEKETLLIEDNLSAYKYIDIVRYFIDHKKNNNVSDHYINVCCTSFSRQY